MTENIISAAGGLGLLIFGMKIMSTGLELVAGDKLKGILQKATSNRFLAVLVGIIATILLNSSTSATIITVGFVNSGLLNLTQALGVILGSNVGTTFSSQIIAFRIDAIAPLFILLGVVMHLFFKKRNVKNIGYVILGFGILLLSVRIMGQPLRQFANEPGFQAMLTAFENPFLAILASFLFTAVVQSSTATTGILVTMHLNGVPIPFETSAYIILGANIGTSITTIFASISASRDSKRAALFHKIFDVIGAPIFGTLIFLFPGISNWFQSTWSDPARQVAMFHTLYNVATLIILLPFVGFGAKLMQKIIPVKEDELKKPHGRELVYLNTKTIGAPTLAVTNAHLEICRMGKIANENLELALEAFFEKSDTKANKVFENEKTIDFLNYSIAPKLVEINNMALSPSDAEKVGEMFRVVSDIERIGDHAENIAEYAMVMKESNPKFSSVAIEELKKLGELTVKITAMAVNTYENQDVSQLEKIDDVEEKVDELSVEFAENHIKRLKTEGCEPKSGVIFNDMITDLERSADHAKNIAFAIPSEDKKNRRRNWKY